MDTKSAFSGFSVNDLDQAKEFYTQTLGLNLIDQTMGLHLSLPHDSGVIYIYPKDDHQPATFTILNFVVDDIDVAVKALEDKDVKFEHYEGMTDDSGIARGRSKDQGPDIAWFKDPAGNILSVLTD